MPGVGHGMGSAGRRVDGYLSVLAGAAPAKESAAEATQLMQQLTRRAPAGAAVGAPDDRPVNPARRKGLWLFAPLRKLRRNLFGGRA